MYIFLRNLTFICLLLPLTVYARGGYGGGIDILGILKVVAFFVAILFLYYFWTFLFGLIILPFTFLISFDKKLNESLATFAISGFFITFMFPVIVIDKNFIQLQWYGYAIVLLLWFFIWYSLARFIQYKGESQRNIDN